MKKLVIILLFLSAGLQLSAYANNLDSLKQKLQTASDSLKGPIYTQIASQYFGYDTVSTRRMKYYFQTEALNYTMLALHSYSAINDTLGLRTSFNNLSKVYRSQRRYSQAKWFALQSNTISRQRKDTLGIIASLIQLSAIKSDNKEYTLAMRDLNDALKLSLKTHKPQNESVVQVAYADLYRQMQNYEKAAIAIKRNEFLNESIKNAELAQLTKTNIADSLQTKKQNIAVAKKKARTAAYKNNWKSNSNKQIASIEYSSLPWRLWQ